MLCAVVFALLFSSFAFFANVQKASAVQINKPWLIKTKIVQQAKKGNNFTAIINYTITNKTYSNTAGTLKPNIYNNKSKLKIVANTYKVTVPAKQTVTKFVYIKACKPGKLVLKSTDISVKISSKLKPITWTEYYKLILRK